MTEIKHAELRTGDVLTLGPGCDVMLLIGRGGHTGDYKLLNLVNGETLNRGRIDPGCKVLEGWVILHRQGA